MYVGCKKIVNTLCDWLQAINSSFIIEGEIGFNCDGKIGIGPIKGEFGADIKHKAIEIATLLQCRGKMKFGTTQPRKKI